MKKIISLFLLTLLIFTTYNSQAAEKEIILKSSQSWDGNIVNYPKGQAQITGVKITLGRGESMPFHCHPVVTTGYVDSGKIEVEKMDGTKKIFKKGDSIIEVMNTWHRGHNLSNLRKVKLMVFYAGAKDVPNTILYNEENKDKCSK